MAGGAARRAAAGLGRGAGVRAAAGLGSLQGQRVRTSPIEVRLFMKNLNASKKFLFVPALILLSATVSVAFAQHGDKEIKEDIQRHRAS